MRISLSIKALTEQEFEKFIAWLADYELEQYDEWDKEIAQDFQTGGRLDSVLKRVCADIASGRTKPLDEIIKRL